MTSSTLSTISTEWDTVRLGDALTLINGRAFKPAEWSETGLPIVRIQNLNNPDAPFNYYEGTLPEKFLLNTGDLLFAWSGTPGTSFGAHIWRGKKACLNQHIFKIKFDEKEFDKRFLQFAINQNLQDYIFQAHGGAGLAHITKGKFENSELPKPPLGIQRDIVAEIEKQFSRLDEAVANLKRVKANLKRYKAAVLKAAVEGRLVETEAELARREGRSYETAAQQLQRFIETRRSQWKGKGKYKEPVTPDTYDLPELPDGWVWASFESLIADGPQNGLYLPKSLYGIGHPILRIDDYQQDWIRPVAELKRVRAKTEDVKVYSLRKGDLVINRVNSPTHLGKVAVWIAEPEMPMFESNMMRIRLAPGVDPFYVAMYLRSVDGRVRLTKQAKWAVNQASINQQDVCNTQIPLPPVIEQCRVVAEVERRFSIIREIESQVGDNLKRAESLRQAILKNGFMYK